MQPSKNLQIQPKDDDGLSALFDGEASDESGQALFRRLGQEAEFRGRWAEYSLIGDVLRGMPYESDRFRQRLQAALEAEPTVLAPMRTPMRSRPAFWMAGAATVAAVTWVVLGASPQPHAAVEMAAGTSGVNVSTYLAAHQDYAQAVTSSADIRLTPVTLAVMEAGR